MFSILGLATWGLRLAIAAPLVAAVLIGLFRFGVMDVRLSLLGVAAATFLAAIAALLSVLALIGGFWSETPQASKALIALVLAVAVLYVPLNTLRIGGSVPPIHDITTDLDNPPVFAAIPAMRTASDNSLALDADVMAQQRTFYTDIAPLMLDGGLNDNVAKARLAAEAMGWEIVQTTSTTIEATATTALFGFKDDVVIRLSAVDGGTKVDMRSVSRIGQSDLGANAARITAYFESLK